MWERNWEARAFIRACVWHVLLSLRGDPHKDKTNGDIVLVPMRNGVILMIKTFIELVPYIYEKIQFGVMVLSAKFLRDSAVTIAPIITHIFNLSIEQGVCPPKRGAN